MHRAVMEDMPDLSLPGLRAAIRSGGSAQHFCANAHCLPMSSFSTHLRPRRRRVRASASSALLRGACQLGTQDSR